MEFDRRVQIRQYPQARESALFGSGYLIAPRLVLTAGHILGDETGPRAGRVTVCRPDAGNRQFPATVRWYRKDRAVDAALVEVDDGHSWAVPESLMDLRTRPPQRWGQLIGTRPHPAAIAGFPRMQKDPDDGRRLDEQLAGYIRPGTGSLADRYEITSTDPAVPLPWGSRGTSLSGMSGSALISGDLLCGVVRRDREAIGGIRLTATPAHILLADDMFRTLLTEYTGWEPIIEPAEPVGLLEPAARERDLRSPAMLLRADVEAVEFQARDLELRLLLAWCHEGQDSFSVRVLTGPGGQGKTRLARHLSGALRRQGWISGHLRSGLADARADRPDLSSLETALPLLLVVDYAETRPHLVRDLIEQLRTTRHRVRLLLLARSDGDWRADALGATAPTREFLACAPVIELGPLIPRSAPPSVRDLAFTRAASDLARHLPHVPGQLKADWPALAATLRPPKDLADPRYDSVLTLQMTALTTLLQQGPAPVADTIGQPAEVTLLRHERRYWEDTAQAPEFQLGLRTVTLERAVAVDIVCGAANRAEAETAVGKIPGLPAEKILATAEWLRALYPPGPSRYWGSLQPDLVAEYHASVMLASDARLLAKLLDGASASQQIQIITVLGRAAIDHYIAHRISDSNNVLHALDSALDAVVPCPEALQDAIVALPISSQVLATFTQRLADMLVKTVRQLAAEDPVTYWPHLANALEILSIRLSEKGQWEQAAAADREAVRTFGALSLIFDVFERDHARSLSHLGLCLEHIGQLEEAMDVGREAVEIYRRLATAHPDAHQPDLAASLNNLSGSLTTARRLEEAMVMAREAVEIYRGLATAHPDAYEPDLAASLITFSASLSRAGQLTDALVADQQAVEIYRQLASANPDAYEPALAASLNNLGGNLSELGHWQDGLTVTEGAVEIRRRLASANPDAYEPDLATSLSNLGAALSKVAQQEQALTVTQEAVEIRRRLATANPDSYEPDLAAGLCNLANRLEQVGRGEEGAAVKQHAVEIYQRLAAADPDAHGPDLATSLSNLSLSLLQLGQWEECLAAQRGAVEVWQQLARADSNAHDPHLAFALLNLSNRLLIMGRWEEATAAEQHALEIYRRLVAADPDRHELGLANTLMELGISLAHSERLQETLAAEQEAVEIYRRLVAADPDRYGLGLAGLLRNLGLTLWRAGRGEEAAITIEQAVTLFQRLALTSDPRVIDPVLREALARQADVLADLGRIAQADKIRDQLGKSGVSQLCGSSKLTGIGFLACYCACFPDGCGTWWAPLAARA